MNILPQKNVRLVLAPMAGITDWPFRLQCQMHGADETVSEMISAMGLLQAPKGNAATKFLLAHHGQEKNLTAQLFGREPDLMGRAAEILSSLPYYKGIDLNFGCPAPKVTSSGSGSALMKDLALSGSILRAVRRATRLPLSVKMRIGWDRNSINAEEFAKLCEDAGVDSLCVHGRTREQQYSGKADWSTIALVKQKVRIPVIANGDVFTPQDAAAILEQTEADGVALGRGALGNPWLFQQIRQHLSGQTPVVPGPQEVLAAALQHLGDMIVFKGERWALIEMRKHFAWYLKGTKGAAAARAKINTTEDLKTLKGILEGHFLALSD